MGTANIRIIHDTSKFLTDVSQNQHYWRRSVMSARAFSRKRCLSFNNLVLMILNLPKRSLNVELQSFFTHINPKTCTKSAFCQQRAKLKPFFFKLWNRKLWDSFYHHYGERVKRWKDFILLAIDGSCMVLPDTPGLRSV